MYLTCTSEDTVNQKVKTRIMEQIGFYLWQQILNLQVKTFNCTSQSYINYYDGKIQRNL